MSERQTLTREQLVEARDKIRRELEVLLSPSSVGGGPPNREVVSTLEAELRTIEDLLANH
jgi:hypothetical protein